MADDKKAKKTSEKKTSDKKATANKTGKKSNEKKSGKNPFTAIGSFFKSVRSEGKKVVWPKPLEVLKNTVTVLVVILILGLVIFGIDQALTQGMKGVKKLAEETTVSEQVEEGTTSADGLSGLVDTLEGAIEDAADGTETDTAEGTEAETEAESADAAEDTTADTAD